MEPGVRGHSGRCCRGWGLVKVWPGERGRDSPKPHCPSVVQLDGEKSAGQTELFSALLGHSSAMLGANPTSE